MKMTHKAIARAAGYMAIGSDEYGWEWCDWQKSDTDRGREQSWPERLDLRLRFERTFLTEAEAYRNCCHVCKLIED